MPICPNCEYEYVEGVKVCPDCGNPLIDEEDFNEHMINPEDWEVVYTASEEYEADMLKANLEGAGIETAILPKKDRNFPAVGDFSVIKIMVKKEDAQTANQIISDINLRKDETDEEE
jgi:hypothetical protein